MINIIYKWRIIHCVWKPEGNFDVFVVTKDWPGTTLSFSWDDPTSAPQKSPGSISELQDSGRRRIGRCFVWSLWFKRKSWVSTWETSKSHDVSWCIMMYHDVSWCIMMYHAHMLHVWNIYQHLPHKWPSHVGKYTVHGAYGMMYHHFPLLNL